MPPDETAEAIGLPIIEKPDELALNHWSYVEALLEKHGEDKATIDKIGFHYRSAMIHGYKHGQEEYERLNKPNI